MHYVGSRLNAPWRVPVAVRPNTEPLSTRARTPLHAGQSQPRGRPGLRLASGHLDACLCARGHTRLRLLSKPVEFLAHAGFPVAVPIPDGRSPGSAGAPTPPPPDSASQSRLLPGLTPDAICTSRIRKLLHLLSPPVKCELRGAGADVTSVWFPPGFPAPTHQGIYCVKHFGIKCVQLAD